MPVTPPDRLVEDPLFLACTRPAMVAGVPMEAMALNVILSATVFLAADALRYLLVAPALHVVCRAVCRHDPNAFRVLWQYVETKGRARTAGLWGGSTASPLPLRRRRIAQEIARG